MKRLSGLLCLLLLACFAVPACASLYDAGYVCNPDPADRLNLRAKPSTSAISLGKFYNGTPVIAQSIDGDWAKVTICGVLSGYMHTDFLAFEPTPCAMPVVTVTAPTGKRIVDSMIRGASVLATLHIGMQMEIMGVMEDWLFVRAGTVVGFTENNGTTPRVYFSAPDSTPAARVPLRPTLSPTPVPAAKYALVVAPVEGARNVTQDDWVIFAALKEPTPLFADRALTKPIDALHKGQFIRVFNDASQYATVVQEDHIAGYIPSLSYTVHSTHWPFSVNRSSAMVANPIPSDRLHLREQPNQAASSLGRYYNGTIVILLDNLDGRSEWTKVEIGGVQGYMMSEYLDFSPAIGEDVSSISLYDIEHPSSDSLHLRFAPDTSSESLGIYPNGTLVAVIGVTGDWAHVICDGQTGYMLHKYLYTAIGTSFDPY